MKSILTLSLLSCSLHIFANNPVAFDIKLVDGSTKSFEEVSFIEVSDSPDTILDRIETVDESVYFSHEIESITYKVNQNPVEIRNYGLHVVNTGGEGSGGGRVNPNALIGAIGSTGAIPQIIDIDTSPSFDSFLEESDNDHSIHQYLQEKGALKSGQVLDLSSGNLNLSGVGSGGG